ncbi:hypothetical protein SAY87_018954 [Trapa incisa]|uniref:C2 domain-containing protein n=1 Tax=Trapa incisa TaxID=236973 RepID=A0AAN7Q1L4_9MYRT|nr:hypothetical protein SAY87_018954 [Trapa incisa]
MGKIWVEVSMISARGLHRSSLLKLQWFAVGWIDPKNKYCSRIDASRNSEPHWNTKFATLIDSSDSGFGELALHIEVYSREPVFLREKLLGTASILLKEFLLKHSKNDSVSKKAVEEVGSYQLRKGNSNKPWGFVDISVRISEEQSTPSSYTGTGGGGGGIVLMDRSNIINSVKDEDSFADPPHAPSTPLPIITRSRANRTHTQFPHGPSGGNNVNSYGGGLIDPPPGGHLPHYQQPPNPLHLPPSNTGFLPTFPPRNKNLNLAGNYVNMPSYGAPPGLSRRPTGFDMGLGAGALAAGALIFGDDFMSGFNIPAGSQDASLTVSLDPPF